MKLLFIVFVISSLVALQVQAMPLPAVIINNDVNRPMHSSYFDGILLKYKFVEIEPGGRAKIYFDENSFVPSTLYIMTNTYIGLSIAIMPGDTVSATYDKENDTYDFAGNYLVELRLYKDFGESKFSTRSVVSPVEYNNGRSLDNFLQEWRGLWRESELRIAKLTGVPGIRPKVKEHFILEARLRLLQILHLPISTQSGTVLHSIPGFYRDTVFYYEKKIIFNSENHSSPQLVFAYRRHTGLLAEREGDHVSFVAQYWIAKREYKGFQREWACYSVLQNMYIFNKDVGFLPSLLTDYQSWTLPNSLFVRELQTMAKSNDLAILLDKSLNDELLTPADELARLFDIIKGHKGKVVYVDLWASWCAPCVAEMPASVNLRAAYRDKSLAVVYLSVDKDRDKWQRAADTFLADAAESYRLKDEHQSGLVKKLKIESIPRYLLLDKQGVLRYSNAPLPGDPALPKLIDALLAEPDKR